jgi:hypothetical protein
MPSTLSRDPTLHFVLSQKFVLLKLKRGACHRSLKELASRAFCAACSDPNWTSSNTYCRHSGHVSFSLRPSSAEGFVIQLFVL